MLIAVVVVFLLCQTPQAVQNVLATHLDGAGTVDGETKTVLLITANVFNLLVVANCCGNFVLYSTFSSKFRLTFRRLLFGGRCGCPLGPRRRRQGKKKTPRRMDSDAALPLRRVRRVDTIVVCNELWSPPFDVAANGRRAGTRGVAVRLARETGEGCLRAPTVTCSPDLPSV